MTSYLHRSKIWMRETPLLSLTSRHGDILTTRDVIWRHFQLLSLKSADISKNVTIYVTQMYFLEESFLRLKKWGVNHFSTTFRSDRIMISTFVGFLMTSAKKCWRQQNIMPNVCRMWVKFKIGMMTHICAKFHAIWTYISEVRTGAYMPLPR